MKSDYTPDDLLPLSGIRRIEILPQYMEVG